MKIQDTYIPFTPIFSRYILSKLTNPDYVQSNHKGHKTCQGPDKNLALYIVPLLAMDYEADLLEPPKKNLQEEAVL